MPNAANPLLKLKIPSPRYNFSFAVSQADSTTNCVTGLRSVSSKMIERFFESDLQQLRKTYSSTIPEPPKIVVKEVIQPTPKKAEKNYWELSFKRMDEPVVLP